MLTHNFDSEITERRDAEKALRESEQRLSSILDSILTGVVIIDAETHEIADTNPLAVKLIGFPKEEIIGKVCHKFICPADEGKCPISDLGQSVDQSERVLLGRDGCEIKILKTVTPMSWQGRDYFVESFIDISELKGAQEKQQELLRQLESTNEELKEFAYIVSHDLKAPLRGIRSIVTWIAEDYADELDDEGKQQINMLINRTDRMQKLIDGVLQYSRIGRMTEEARNVDLEKLLPEIIDLLSPPDNISITIENKLPVIKCEQTRITQVFQNLLSNAIKYVDKPSGVIKIGCLEENGFLKFSVSDNGPGIEEKHHEIIFKVFQTLNRRDDIEGTGIGLSVVKKIISLYGGKIWVESELGQGSSFFFTLPQNIKVHSKENSETPVPANV